MKEIIIAVYILINLVIIFIYYKRDLGVFQAPFILSCVSLTIILPQLTTIYFHPYYNKDLLYKLGFVMISCNIFFAIGFDRGKKKKAPSSIRTFNTGRLKYLTLVFSLIGFSTVFLYGSLSGAIDSVIAANLKAFAVMGLALSLISLLQGSRSLITYAGLILSVIPMINFAFFVKASRIDSLILFLNLLLFLSLKIPRKRGTFKFIVLMFLLLGSILSASITALRTYVKDEENKGDLSEVSYWDKFASSFTDSHTDAGMDLGNAAIAIEYVYQNDTYDYGLQVWNGFVYNYVPKRLVGAKVKEDLAYEAGYEWLLPKLTDHTTTMTGYFFAFSAFSFLGFLCFYGIGYALGVIWMYAGYSNLYKFLYFYTISMVPIMLTHGFQVLFAYIEFITIFIYPILALVITKINIKTTTEPQYT